MAVLQLAKLVWKIPTWNGPDAYSLGTNKWCHHVLFQRAGLHSPETLMCLEQPKRDCEGPCNDGHVNQEQEAVRMLLEMERRNRPLQTSELGKVNAVEIDYLIKPNAGGFGAGIERRRTSQHCQADGSGIISIDSSQSLREKSNNRRFSDNTVLFQKYITPANGKIYRVWFLRGRVHCAVERTISANDVSELQSHGSLTGEFTTGCVGGVCERPKTSDSINASTFSSIMPWSVPLLIRQEIEEKLLTVLPEDTHCGSVEFLLSPIAPAVSCNDNLLGQSERLPPRHLYFDLNLLSTLPLEQDHPEDIIDPWVELAEAIVDFCKI